MNSNNIFSPLYANIISGVSFITGFAALINILPAVSTTLGIVWFLVALYDSRPVTNWLKRRREHKIQRLSAKLQQLRSLAVEKIEDDEVKP